MSKSQLIPIKVPWQIGEGATLLDLHIQETQPPILMFRGSVLQAEFLIKHKESTLLETNFDLSNSKTSVEVRVELGNFVKIQITPPYNSIYPIRPDDYDWISVDVDFQPYTHPSIETWKQNQKKLIKQWLETGVCPLPNVYEVENSQMFHSVTEQIQVWGQSINDFKHYIFIAEDIIIETISKRWKWSIVENEDELSGYVE